MKEEDVRKAINVLEGAGFQVSDCSQVRSCFDLLARRGDVLLLVKVLGNIEGVTYRLAAELRSAAHSLSGTPLIVGDHMKTAALAPGIIYTRYDVHVVNMESFSEMLGQKIPLIYSVRGNYCVRINCDLLSQIRKKENYTQEELAEKLGVSKQSIHRYESSGRISLEIAERLVDLLKEDLMLPGKVLAADQAPPGDEVSSFLTDLKKAAFQEFRNMGLAASFTNAPFDIIAAETAGSERILTIASDDRKGLMRKAEIIKEIAEMTGCLRVCITNRSCDLDVVVIKPRELSEIKEKEEFIRILSEFQE
jgi:putative transcriptional regulator